MPISSSDELCHRNSVWIGRCFTWGPLSTHPPQAYGVTARELSYRRLSASPRAYLNPTSCSLHTENPTMVFIGRASSQDFLAEKAFPTQTASKPRHPWVGLEKTALHHFQSLRAAASCRSWSTDIEFQRDMPDGDQGGSIAWRRKLLSSTTSSKSSSKTKNASASSSTPTKPALDRAPSSSPSYSDLTSADVRTDGPQTPMQNEGGDGRTQFPRRSSAPNTPSGIAGIPWPSRARTDSIREEDEAQDVPGPTAERSNGAAVKGGSVRAAVELIDADRLRKMNATRKSPQPRVSSRGSTDGDSAEDDGEKEMRRGSVIREVAHRAKMSLPLRRHRDHGATDRPESPAPRSSTPGSLEPTKRNDSGSHLPKVSIPGTEQEDVSLPESPVLPTAASAARHKKLPGLLTARGSHDASPGDAGDGVSIGGPQTSPFSPTRVMSPPTVRQSGMANGSVDAGQDTQIPRSGVVKRSNKIMDLASCDLNEPSPAAERGPRSVHLNGSGVGASRRKPSMNSIKEGVEESTVSMTTTTTPTDAAPPPRAATVSVTPAAAGASSSSVSSERPHALPTDRSSYSTNAGSSSERVPTQRATSAMKVNSMSSASVSNSTVTKAAPGSKAYRERKAPTREPPMPDVDDEKESENELQAPTPASGMYWSRAPCFGHNHNALRAHTATLVGSNIYVFGGCDSQACFNDLYVFDADCMYWTAPECTGDIPPVLRAMTATAVGKKIVVIGGGDGPAYYNDVYVLDTTNRRYSKAKMPGPLPANRRAHTACLYKHGIYVFGGGDGEKALNDVWRLDVSDLSKPSWRLISPSSKSRSRPTARGYHTASMVGSKLIIFGGSDGVDCFRDVWVFDVETSIWKPVKIDVSFPRLSHTSTVVGSYMFVIGGHDGVEYSSDVLLLNLVTMQWDKRKVYGHGPSGRGYHATVLHDSRLFIIGGFDGNAVFDHTFILELAINAYYPQISHFTVDV